MQARPQRSGYAFDEPEEEVAAAAEREAAGNDVGAGRFQPPTFVRHVVTAVQRRFHGAERSLQVQARGRLAKFWFGYDGRVHYEVWVHDRTSQLELGLHFESAPEYNRALYTSFDRCMLEIQNSLGSSFWLEEWDRGWVRLYETHPLYPLDAYRLEEIVSRLCEIIAVLQPIYEEIAAHLPPAPPPPPEPHWRPAWRK